MTMLADIKENHSQGQYVREYNAIEIRSIVQQLFPNRKLVLSQFTFFGHLGVAKATGNTFRRGRRCYRLIDILSVACVLSLKEQGIPLRNIESVPSLIQHYSKILFSKESGCKLSGYGNTVSLFIPGESEDNSALSEFLNPASSKRAIFWTFDISALVANLKRISAEEAVHSSMAA